MEAPVDSPSDTDDIATADCSYSNEVENHRSTSTDETNVLRMESASLHDDLKEVFVVYEYIMNGSTQIQDLESSDVLRRVHDVIEVQKAQQASMPTPKLWIQFMNMMDIVRKFLRSERTGN